MHRWTVLAFLVLGSCHSKSFFEKPIYSSQNMSRSSSEIELPSSLWDQIEKVYTSSLATREMKKDEGEKKSEKSESQDEPHLQIPTEFTTLKVFLVEKTHGVLGDRNFELTFGEGGGDLDLQDFVSDINGTFYMGMRFGQELADSPLHVFFLSNSRQRKLSGEIYGSGCGHYFDITSFFNRSMKGSGFEVNTTNQRAVSALAGTFFLSAVISGKLYLSQLTVRDSRYRALQCRR
jgi:hypothetical protein